MEPRLIAYKRIIRLVEQNGRQKSVLVVTLQRNQRSDFVDSIIPSSIEYKRIIRLTE